jgi:hypothetical protein
MTKQAMISVVSDARICAGNPNPANALNSYRDNGPAANPIHLKCSGVRSPVSLSTFTSRTIFRGPVRVMQPLDALR